MCGRLTIKNKQNDHGLEENDRRGIGGVGVGREERDRSINAEMTMENVLIKHETKPMCTFSFFTNVVYESDPIFIMNKTR